MAPGTSEETKTSIRDFLGASFKSHRFEDDEDIFESGFVNSMFALQLVMFIEKRFELQLADEDLELANFRTINAIEQLVSLRLGAAGI